MTIRQVKKKLEQRLEGLAKERGKLRELEDEIAEQAEVCDRAMDALESAIDALSEIV